MEEVHIATVSETKLNGPPPRIQNYTWVIKNRTTGGGGVAILIRNNILPSTRIIDEFEQDDIEALWIKLINPKKDIAIGVFYCLQENNNKEAP